MSKLAALLRLATLIVSSLIVIRAAPASASLPLPQLPVPKSTASVSEFTVKLVAYSYDVPATYIIDPFTGKNMTIQEGFHVENKSVEIAIKNQPGYNLFYNVRYKGHFGEEWIEPYHYKDDSPNNLPPQSSSGYKVLSISTNYDDGALVDFQVQAVSWVYIDVFVYDHPWYPELGGYYEQNFTLRGTSGWSKMHTVTIPANPSIVTLLSLQNGNFSTSDVPLDFVMGNQASELKYSLDD